MICFKVEFSIHCIIVLSHYNLLNIKNLINLVSLKRHGRAEYYKGKYFEKKRRIEAEKNEDEHFQLLMKIATNCKFWSQKL